MHGMPVCCRYCHGKLSSRRWKRCPHCDSPLSKNDIKDCTDLRNNNKHDPDPCICPKCKGTGWIEVSRIGDIRNITRRICPKCDGSGRIC